MKKDHEYPNEELVAIAREFPDFRSPSFQLYTNDFLGSSHTAIMDADVVGAYCLLLMYEWGERDCGLPADPELLRRLTRLSEERWACSSRLLVDLFFEQGGRLYNRRLLQERRKQIERREQRIVAARASSKSRPRSVLRKPAGAVESHNESTPAVRQPSDARGRTEFAVALYDVWSGCKSLTQHKKLTMDMAKNAVLWIGQYSFEELASSIRNYDAVLTGPGYWFSYRFTFEDFFRRGSTQKPAPFKKFLAEASPLVNFKAREAGAGQTSLVEDDHYERH